MSGLVRVTIFQMDLLETVSPESSEQKLRVLVEGVLGSRGVV